MWAASLREVPEKACPRRLLACWPASEPTRCGHLSHSCQGIASPKEKKCMRVSSIQQNHIGLCEQTETRLQFDTGQVEITESLPRASVLLISCFWIGASFCRSKGWGVTGSSSKRPNVSRTFAARIVAWCSYHLFTKIASLDVLPAVPTPNNSACLQDLGAGLLSKKCCAMLSSQRIHLGHAAS